MKLSTAIQHINRHGILLTFPLNNKKEPRSLWSEFYPRSKMRWEWDAEGDGRVSGLWHMREKLSRSDEVVYTKWYQGRATFFSRPVFTSCLRLLNPHQAMNLHPLAQTVYDALEEDSPLSTKVLKQRVELQGRSNEGLYNRALKELWQRLLIVGYGEVDEGAFPSLAIGATRLIFEDLWDEAWRLSPERARQTLAKVLEPTSPFRRPLRTLLTDS